MTAALAQDVLDPAVLAIVGSTATRLAGTYGFNPADRDDIGQELHLDCVIRLRKFVPTKSSRSTFVRRIVHHRVATLLCAQRAACRDYRRCRDSLDGPVPYGAAESVPLGETVSADDYESWIGRTGRSSWERTELRIDVSHVIAALPPELAAIALLLRSIGATETARALQLPRATLYRRLGEIRHIFEKAGLGLYTARPRAASVWVRHGSPGSAAPVVQKHALEKKKGRKSP